MHPAPFSYVAPVSIGEAIDALTDLPEARVIAGGQSLLPMMKLRLISPRSIVDLGHVPGLGEISGDDNEIQVGPLATHAAVAADPRIGSAAAALADAAAVVGDPLVRNRGTIGGSASHADPVGDEPGALLALGARFDLRGPDGDRELAADEFFLDAFTTALAGTEVLTAIRLDAAGPGEGSAYRKLGRRGGARDYPVAGAAAWVRLDGDTVVACRVAITGAAIRTTRAAVLEDRITGHPVGAIAEEASLAAEGVTVVGDVYGSKEYKQHLVGVLAKRALQAAAARAR